MLWSLNVWTGEWKMGVVGSYVLCLCSLSECAGSRHELALQKNCPE